MKNVTLITLFGILSLGGVFFLMNYAGQAGAPVVSIGEWPSQSKLDHSKNFHLIMFLHPGCSCSKASLAELSRLMSEAPELSAQIVVMKSPKLEKLFHENALIKQAKIIPRTKIIYDQDGAEAHLFKAETSGLTHLYSQSTLVFAGGLTMARGHEGESVGKQAILSFLKGKESHSKSLVFGCDIFNSIKTLSMVK